MAESINFNRAATFYDATRKLRDEVADEITKVLLAEIRAVNAERVLEVGIGTGRMARPLMLADVPMVGVDISTEMMGQLLAQLTPGHRPPELFLADATSLPFRGDAFRAVLIVHVLHLVSSIEGTLAEMKRVLAPGGVLLHQTHRADTETQAARDSHEEFWDRMCARHDYVRRRRPTANEVHAAMVRSGGTCRTAELSDIEELSTVELELQKARSKTNSWSWVIPDEILAASMGEFEAWLKSHADADGNLRDRSTYVIEVWSWA